MGTHNNFWAHFHLMVNDIPILGFLFASVFLVLALTTNKQDGWARAGMLTIAIAMLGVLAAFFSGSPAVDVINGQPRTSGRALSQHHVRGLIAISLAAITVVLAIVATVKARKNSGFYYKRLLMLVFIAAILSTAPLAWTGMAGGRINHPELQLPDDSKEGPAHPH